MPRRGHQLIVAATPQGGRGGWLSQWFQGLVQGQKGKADAKGGANNPPNEHAADKGRRRAHSSQNMTSHS